MGDVQIIDETTEITPESYRYLALEVDAERLAELRVKRAVVYETVNPGWHLEINKLDILIAVYEECAARGLTFGGGR